MALCDGLLKKLKCLIVQKLKLILQLYGFNWIIYFLLLHVILKLKVVVL